MNDITWLTQINYQQLFTDIFAALIGFLAMLSVLEKITEKTGLEFRWQRKNRDEHNLLADTVHSLSELKEKHEEDTRQSIRHDDMIRSDLKKLTDMFIDKEINDLRWEIINTADKLSNGKSIGKECYKHCLKSYDKYEQIISENNFTNSEVDVSIDIVRKSYAEKGYKD